MSTTRRDLRTSGDLVMAPRVPHGLAAAVEGLTREVIRHRPEDIYVFAAQHFEELLKLRDEYGAVTNLPGKSATNTSALREMNKSLKKRSGADKIERSGWSMNETARVLERHRSIFGDKGRKVSTDEVRALGNEKENKSDLEMPRRRPGSNERFVRRKVNPKENPSDASRNPKIISQIPTLNQPGGLLAKDIKSELRKNRNSSRDRRGTRERTERKATERLKTLTRSSREASLDKLTERDDRLGANNQRPKTDALSKIPRTLSMDRVRDFVVKKFRSSESWEELSSTNYVDRVQEVIDDAAPSILRKVNELTTRSAGRTGRGYESVDESTSTSTRSDKSNQTDDVRSRSAMSGSRRSRKSRRTTKSKTSGADSLEGIETLASETGNEAEPTKTKSPAESEASSSPNLSLPAVRPPSSKNNSRSVSRSDSDNLVLPPISPEAPKSAKLREELVLPSLQVPREVVRDLDEVELMLPDPPTDEVFKDSLNVTPDMAVSPRPDSLDPNAVRVDVDAGEASASVSEKLMEIQEAEEQLKSILDSGQNVELGMKEKLMEIEETERKIESILKPEVQEVQEIGMKERLMEIEESEKRIEKILNTEAQGVQEIGMEEKLMEIEETEKRIESILKPEVQEVQGIGMKERLMEIEETEKRIEKIFNTNIQDVEVGVKEKLIEIQESEKRIEKILNPDAQENEEETKERLMEMEETEKRIEKFFNTNVQDVEVGVKEKLIEIQESEKRIEKILNPDVQENGEEVKEKLIDKQESEEILDSETKSDKNDTGFVKDKLIEIEEAEKRLRNVLDSTSDREGKHNHDQNLKAINSAPKTPFIPEIPSEYVTSANEVVATPDEAEHARGSKESQLPQESNNADDTDGGLKETKGPGVEILSSGTPDSLGTSYVLTEGSPYEIPDSVTTVIIPERQADTPSSDVVEIVLEDYDDVPFKEGEEGHISLRNILDNFGEVVDQEAHLRPSSADVDFIRNLKTPTDLVITRKDLDQIREEEDKDVAEIEAGSIALTDIAESEEILEEKEGQPQSLKKHEEPLHLEGAKGAFEDRNTETSGSLDPEETLELKIMNITDSGTTESTDEVKETTISDDGGNTAAESSVTSPSCGEDVKARNSESSNEVKETTISDQPVDGNGKNLLSLAPQCFGSMPHVPELNLDSLQDITVSSFQLSDDQTAEEDSEAAPLQSGNGSSYVSQDREPVHEDTIIKERLAVKEDPCTKVSTYVTEPDTDSSEIKDTAKCELEETECEEKAEEECKNVYEDIQEVRLNGRETVEGVSPETEAEEELIEVHEEAAVTGPEGNSKEVSAKEAEEKSEDVEEIVPQKDCHEIAGKSSEEVHEDVSETVSGESSENMSEKKTDEKSDAILEKKPEEVHEKEVVGEAITEGKPEVVHKKIVEVVDATEKVIGEGSERVNEEQVIEEVTKKTIEDENLFEDVTDKPSAIELEKVSDEVDEKMLKQEVEKVEEEPEEVLKHVTEILVLDEKPGMEPETILGEVPKTVVETLLEEEPEEVHKKVAEKVPQVNSEKVLEESSVKGVEILPEKRTEEVHGKEVEKLVEKDSELKHEEILGTMPHQLAGEKTETKPENSHEEVVKELRNKTEEDHEEIHEEASQGKNAEKHGEKAAETLEEKLEETLKKNPEEEHEVTNEQKPEKKHEEIPKEKPDDTPKENPKEEHEETLGKNPEEKHDETQKLEEKYEETPRVEHEEKPEETPEKNPEEKHEETHLKKHEEKHEETPEGNPEEKHEAKHEEKHEGSLDEFNHDVTRQKSEELDVVLVEKVIEESQEKKPKEIVTISDEVGRSKAEEDPEEAVSFNIIKPTAPPAEFEEKPSSSDGDAKKAKVECENDQQSISTSISSVPEVASSRSLEEAADRPASAEIDNHVAFMDPPKAEVVTNDLDDYPNSGERMEYHIYVPEVAAAGSQDGNSTTESSTFNSAATKIQAGVRGFLTRRRLQSAQRRSSTLDSVPSIQDSVAADASHLEPIEEVGLAQAATTIQSNYRGYKARQRLRREDAVQKNTMSVENAFSGNGLQHTGEFHDCLPLPPLQLDDVERSAEDGESQDSYSKHENMNCETASSVTNEESVRNESNFVESALQSQYLNFITSIEEVPDETDHSIIHDVPDASKAIDAFSTLRSTAGIESLPLDNPSVDSNVSVREPLAVPGTPTGLIIEELSKTEDSLPAAQATDSLELPGLSLEGCKAEDKEKEASLGTMSFSMNVDDMLGLGAEGDTTSKMKPILEVTFTPRDLLKLSNRSTSGDRVESPVTMMQIVPKSMEDDGRVGDEALDRHSE